MTVAPGAFVRHTEQASWGTGRVLELVGSDKVRIRFAHAGEKVLALQVARLEAATPSASEARLLTGPSPRLPSTLVPRPHEDLVGAFLRAFPGGFGSSAYWEQEREYKLKAHNLALDEIPEERLRAALAAGRFDEVVTGALRVMNDTNLVFPNEKMAFRDGLGTSASREEFSRRLFALLYGSSSFQVRFESFADFLFEANAAKWTIATYFPFIRFPREHMFLKPGVTQKAADAYGFWLAYDANLNWHTYEQLLAFAEMLQERLAPLAPVDMLDVQSFLWVAGRQE